MSDVYLDNKFVGTVSNPISFCNDVRSGRRTGALGGNVNVYYDEVSTDVFVEVSKGRLRRPLIVVSEGKPMLTSKHFSKLESKTMGWSDLMKEGVIEYIDAAEEENCLVAMVPEDITPKHTHLEISPIAMFSITTSLIPYANFTASQKIVAPGVKSYKQAVGFYSSAHHIRLDVDVNLLHYPQAPVLSSVTSEFVDFNKHPSGQNVVVAVMPYWGYNMEDSVVVKKSSVERGFGRSTYYKPISTEEVRYTGGIFDEIKLPDKDVRGYRSETDYRFLEEDGIVYPEARVGEGDVVIGRVSPPRFMSDEDRFSLTSNLKREGSVSMQHSESGIVDLVMLTENSDGNKLVQVKLRDNRIPEVGDKFVSRQGQKGIIGLLIPESDMPYSVSGVIPDILFSPHSLPSRMTLSHIMESVVSKFGGLAGRYVDGTCFDSESCDDLREQLLDFGFSDDGEETMFDGITGKKFDVKIFIGSIYYMRLKHMVANKILSRGRGPIVLLTRQPTEGRKKEGGLRIGEMEKDAIVAHGASMVLKERFDSDSIAIPVCEKCGLLAVFDEYKRNSFCNICGDSEVSVVEVSYAFKLLLDELKSLCIYPKINLEDKY